MATSMYQRSNVFLNVMTLIFGDEKADKRNCFKRNRSVLTPDRGQRPLAPLFKL